MSAGRGTRIAGGIALAILILVVLAAIYALTLGPHHSSNLQAEAADGTMPHEIASASSGLDRVDVVPGEAWQVQPLVQQIPVPLLRDLPRPPLPNDPRVALGLHAGVLVTSPDGGLEVRLTVLPTGTDAERVAEQLFSEYEPSASEGAAGADGASSSGDAAVLTETLASGAVIHHVSDDEMLAGSIDVAGATVQFESRLTGDADDGARTLDDYRPVLSALLESVSAN